MSDIYILENKLKKQPHLHLHTRYQSFNNATKNHFKILTFWHVIDDNFTKMFQTRTARNNTHLQAILPHSSLRLLRSSVYFSRIPLFW